MEQIDPPRSPRSWRASAGRGLLWAGGILLAAYVYSAFVATGFNLWLLGQHGPDFARVARELLHPDLSWNAHALDGSLRLNPLTGKPDPGTLRLLLGAMNITVMTGLVATLLSILFSFALAFPAAKNLSRGSPAGRLRYGMARAVLNTLRAIEPLVLGIVFVITVGPGPFAATLALALHSIGSLGKLFAEAIEQVDPLPVEAVRATGASNFLTVWFGVLPQVAPQMLAFSLYRWDLNIRMGIVLGIVGAGGIGFYLKQYIDLFQYNRVATALLIILVAVSLLDWASGYLREKLG